MQILLHTFEISYVFKLQDKHNASSISNMSWKELPQFDCKKSKNILKKECRMKKFVVFYILLFNSRTAVALPML